MKNKLLYALFFMTLANQAMSQIEKKNEGWALLPHLSFSFQQPGGDLANRFGASNAVGGGVDFLTEKNNIILGVEGNYIFGTTVKEDVLAWLRDADGAIIGNAQSQTSVVLRERGFYLGGVVGKLFSVLPQNPRSGIRATIGVGILQHRIRLQDDNSAVQQISGNNSKGYDRLSNGIAFNGFIGYQHLAKNRRFNMTVGVELTQGFTQSRRGFNYDTQMADTQKRKDSLVGFKMAWTVPFYIGENAEQIFY